MKKQSAAAAPQSKLPPPTPKASVGSRFFVGGLTVVLLGIITAGLFWLFTVSSSSPVGAGWFAFSFAAGLSMIVLPCTLPLAFVIVPLVMGKGYAKGLAVALSFSLGVVITLSMYGVLAAVLGKAVFAFSGAEGEIVKNIFYTLAGIFAIVFALGDLGFLKARMPSYGGAVPGFIQNRTDILKPFLMGLFLGNIGVGCPHPATPIILGQIGVTGDIFYGWLLFFVHAIGRVLPLLVLAMFGIIGINATKALVRHRASITKATGWGMVFVGAFLFTLGFFGHDWWVYSGQHVLFEDVVQEERFTNILRVRFDSTVQHVHGIPEGNGFFNLPLWLGNWVFVLLIVGPVWWYWYRERERIRALPQEERAPPESLLRWMMWFFVMLTLLLEILFIYVLPHRFLAHQALEHGAHDTVEEETMHEHSGHAPASTPAQQVTAGDISHGAGDIPPPITREENSTVVIDLEATQLVAELDNGITYEYWAFNKKVPGPFIRVLEGDTVEVRLTHSHDHTAYNAPEDGFLPAFTVDAFIPFASAAEDDHEHGTHEAGMTAEEHAAAGHGEHSIDLHAVQGPGGGANLMRVPPNETRAFQFKATKPGIYIYHCGSPHVATHIANGMYGLILVEPAGGLPPVDREFYVVQGELYTTGALGEKGHQEFSLNKLLEEQPEYIVFNGRMSALSGNNALRANVGEKIRIFFGVSGQLASNFHIIGEILDNVYREGDLYSPPARNIQTTLVPGGGAMVTEFTVDVPGKYLLVDHALSRALNRGAIGELIVAGPEQPALYRSIDSLE